MTFGGAAVLGIVPSNRPDVCFLTACSSDGLPLMLAPDDYRNPLLPLGFTPLAEDRSIALFHPLTRRYVCAAPIEADHDTGAVTADRDRASDWERFALIPVPEDTLPPRLLASASVLETVLDIGPEIGRLVSVLAGADRIVVNDVLHAYWPLLTLAELQRIGREALDTPGLSAKLAALCPGDVWATAGLPGLADWIARREPRARASEAAAGARRSGPLGWLGRSLFGHRQSAEPPTPTAQLPRSSKRRIGADLEILADAGLRRGTFESFGHVCNAYARAGVRPRHDICIIATARNEGIYILEWIAYHRAIGVEAFFLYSNDNDDGSDELLAALADAGVITWIDNQVEPGGSAQGKAYGHAFTLLPDALDYRWALVIDLDEYFVFNPAMFRSARDFLRWQEMRTADAIAMNWIFMGSGGERRWRDLPVTRRFKRAVDPANPHVKTACRPGMFIHSGPHFPRTDTRRSFVYRHATGELHSYHDWASRMPDHAQAFSDHPNVSLAGVQHYFFKSAEEYLWKFSRNRGDFSKSEGFSTASLEEISCAPFWTNTTRRISWRWTGRSAAYRTWMQR